MLNGLSDTKFLLQIGACLSVLIGAPYSVVTARLLFPTPSVSWLQALFLITYTLLAFLPFIAFVFPGLKTPRKPVVLSAAVIEILVLG